MNIWVNKLYPHHILLLHNYSLKKGIHLSHVYVPHSAQPGRGVESAKVLNFKQNEVEGPVLQ